MTIRSRIFAIVAVAALVDGRAALAQASRASKPLAPLKVIDTSYMDR